MDFTYEDIARMIDHSLLNPTLTDAQLEEGLAIALAYDTASVCILPHYLARAAERLTGSDVKPSTTSAFRTVATPRRSRWPKPNGPWPMAAWSWTWSATFRRS